MATAFFLVMVARAEYNYVKQGLQILDQHKRPTTWGNNWCAPTSAAISLSWFAEHAEHGNPSYPGLLPDYDNDGDKDIDDKYELANRLGRDYMNTNPNTGTDVTDKVDGITNYIRDRGYGNDFTVKHFTGNQAKPVPFADYKSELEKCEDVLVGTPRHVMVGWAVNNTQNPNGTYNVGFIDPERKEKYNTTMTSTGKFNYPPGTQTYLYDMVSISPKPHEIIDPIERIDPPTYAVVVEGHIYVIHGTDWENNEVFVTNGVVYGVPYGNVYNTTGTVYAFANGTTIIVGGTFFPVEGSVYIIDGSYRQVVEEVPVGGYSVPIDIPVHKFGLLAPYIGLASGILVATVATAIYVKRAKHRKEKQ
jgi:hypothetical protein